jgi:hypothetical protein
MSDSTFQQFHLNHDNPSRLSGSLQRGTRDNLQRSVLEQGRHRIPTSRFQRALPNREEGVRDALRSVVSMVGGLHGVTLLHSIGRAGVEERSYSNGVEWSGVISGYSMELHGVPKGDVAKPNRA